MSKDQSGRPWYPHEPERPNWPPRIVIPDDAKVGRMEIHTDSHGGTVQSGGACCSLPVPEPKA